MKRIEDIESLSPEALEAAALEQDVPVPEGLDARIREALAGEAALDRPRVTVKRRVLYASLAAAAAVAAVVVVNRSALAGPRDTFDDPYLAYAQVEETFRQLSDKMAFGLDMADQARDAAEKPIQIIKKINER